MPFSSSIIVQLTVIGLLATLLFFIAYRLPQIVSSSALLVIIPIQPIDSQYASANVLLSYVIFLAMLLKGGTVRLPLLPQFLVVLFCYLVSMSMVHKALYGQHAVYLMALVSAYMVLCIAYDLTMRLKKTSRIVDLFIAMNIIVAIYCAIQILAGPGVKVVPFGIQEMAMIPGRTDNRLTGPFAATGITSEYLVIMLFFILHRLLFGGTRRRLWLILLAGLNLAFLVATGNRGGFLSLLGGAVLFIWLFRKELGSARVFQLVTGGSILVALMSALIVTYSDYGRLYERLGETTVEEGIPDTRQTTWPLAWAKIKERPLFGHGPRFLMQGGEDGVKYPGWEYQLYPHNLYLFLLATVGVLGLIAFMYLLLTPLVRCWKVSKVRSLTVDDVTFVRLGALMIIIILVDQVKVEFMRFALVDYWHFVFALLGVFCAACDRARVSASVPSANGFAQVTAAGSASASR
jgi:O-antigen ligase